MKTQMRRIAESAAPAAGSWVAYSQQLPPLCRSVGLYDFADIELELVEVGEWPAHWPEPTDEDGVLLWRVATDKIAIFFSPWSNRLFFSPRVAALLSPAARRQLVGHELAHAVAEAVDYTMNSEAFACSAARFLRAHPTALKIALGMVGADR